MGEINFDVPFSPSVRYRRLLWQYAAIFALLALCTWMIPVLLLAPTVARVAALIVAAAILLPLAYWIPKYYGSISYTIGSEDIMWKRGVWFKTTGIVPYQKITNIDIGQGPLSRRLGIGSLKVQTAGYSASKQGAEISINGIEQFESLRDMIMPYVRASRTMPGAPAPERPQDDKDELLDEVRAIRKLLEER